MADRDAIISFCDQLLETGEFEDWGPNGLQVPGSGEVTKVATAVSAHLESIEAAVRSGAELLICHHGLFWDFHPRALTEAMAARLKTALEADLSVAAYHLPLDANPVTGNNALLCRELGAEPEPARLGEAKGSFVGMVGRFPEPLPLSELVDRVRAATGDREPLTFEAGPDPVGTLGVVSGAAASAIHEAIELGLDAFITGEPAEHVMADASEGGISFFAAGHYATEVPGIRNLGLLVAQEFGVEEEFIDIPNPV
ncbi:MAG: Nif3-like dinuclear metal center hexameric protein [Solirubrobacterales bacterium]